VGETARQVRVVLELPDDVWDDLAERADALLAPNQSFDMVDAPAKPTFQNRG
jgi:hypothetical protein